MTGSPRDSSHPFCASSFTLLLFLFSLERPWGQTGADLGQAESSPPAAGAVKTVTVSSSSQVGLFVDFSVRLFTQLKFGVVQTCILSTAPLFQAHGFLRLTLTVNVVFERLLAIQPRGF